MLNVKKTSASVLKDELLILGDGFTKNCSQILCKLLDPNRFSIEGFVKPNFRADELDVDFFDRVKDYTNRDHVVVMFNQRNIHSIKKLAKTLFNIMAISKFTNLLILSELDHYEQYNSYRYSIANIVKKFSDLNRNISLEHISIINRGNNMLAKRIACDRIRKYICSYTSNTVIKSITPVHDVATIDIVSKYPDVCREGESKDNELSGQVEDAEVDSKNKRPNCVPNPFLLNHKQTEPKKIKV